jgi:hypothetical protein
MVAVIAVILIASWVVGPGRGHGNSRVDAFPRPAPGSTWRLVAVGCMVGRGLAKFGSRDSYWAEAATSPRPTTGKMRLWTRARRIVWRLRGEVGRCEHMRARGGVYGDRR